jgi:hypothetical protein
MKAKSAGYVFPPRSISTQGTALTSRDPSPDRSITPCCMRDAKLDLSALLDWTWLITRISSSDGAEYNPRLDRSMVLSISSIVYDCHLWTEIHCVLEKLTQTFACIISHPRTWIPTSPSEPAPTHATPPSASEYIAPFQASSWSQAATGHFRRTIHLSQLPHEGQALTLGPVYKTLRN